MKFVIFGLLFVGVSFANPQSNILSLVNNSVISSVVGLVNDIPDLLNDPLGMYLRRFGSIYKINSHLIVSIDLVAVKGVLIVVPTAFTFSLSIGNLSDSVNDLTTFISTSPDAGTALTQNLDSINDALDVLISAAPGFSQAIHANTDESGNLDIFNLENVINTLNAVSKAEYGVSSAIQAKINGVQSGSTTDLSDLARKIEETSAVKEGFALVADDVHGVSAIIFGTAADVISLNINIANLSQALYGLSDAISGLSDPSIPKLVSALNALAKTEAKVSESFDRLNELL